MSKRSAVDEALGGSPLKKLHIDPDFVDTYDDDVTTTQTPSSMNEFDPDSPPTAATTPRAKFPSDLKTLHCTWPGCDKTFNRPARLRDHLNSHTNSRPFKCPYDDCDKDYTVDKHLKQHIKAVHTLERKHVCSREGCGKSFVTGTRLKRHQAVHEGEDRFRCTHCGQSFRKKETLNKHVRKEHLSLSAYPCAELGCTSAFDTRASLKRHHDREHGAIRFWCHECLPRIIEDGTEERVGFTTELKLQAHVKQEHQNCLFCEFKSTTQGELERHVEFHHSGKTAQDRKTHPCTYPKCGKKFTTKSNCTNHIRTAHEGLRYICGEVDLRGAQFQGWANEQGCGKQFSTKIKLEDHVRYLHLGIQRPKLSAPARSASPHPASLIDDIAGIANLNKANINCPNCSDTFIRYADLDNHLTKAHSITETDDNAQPLSEQLAPSLFDQEYSSIWPQDMPQEEIFAAEMDYGPPPDEWAEDEANLLLLTRDIPDLDAKIDPALEAI